MIRFQTPSEQRSRPRSSRRARVWVGLALLVAVACLRGCAARGKQPADAPAAPPPAGPTTARLTTAQAPTHVLTEDTIFGRPAGPSEGGVVVWVPISADTPVVLVRAEREWSRVRLADGRDGIVPTVRLDPKVDFEEKAETETEGRDSVWRGILRVKPREKPEVLPVGRPVAVSPVAVDQAVQRGKAYLLDQLDRNGGDNWEAAPAPLADDRGVKGARWGELTALSTLALLTSGTPPSEARLGRTLTWLHGAKIDTAAVLALRLQVYGLEYRRSRGADADEDAANLIDAEAKHLLHLVSDGELGVGLYATGQPGNPGNPRFAGAAPYDLGINQAGPWGLKAANGQPAGVDWRSWDPTDAVWRRAQRTDGGWYNQRAGPAAVRVATTAGGAAALLLARRGLGARVGGGRCEGGPADAELEAALGWLDAHADDAIGDPAAMFTVGGLALAAGRRYFGASDWYGKGADYLLHHQERDGSWPAAPSLTGADPDARKVLETAYAILFLARGGAPLVMNKLAYELPADKDREQAGRKPVFAPGNQRPDDVPNFVDWVSRQTDRPLNWRAVTLSMPREDLAAAPVLYVAGSEPLAFNKDEKALLRDYVLRGGLILGNADCGSTRFAKSFTALGQDLFPRYEFRPLPPDHVLLARERFAVGKMPGKPLVRGLSNGVRELMLLVPEQDLSRDWQVWQVQPTAPGTSSQLGLDVLMYASRTTFLGGGAGGADPADPARPTPFVARDPAIKADRKIRVARLDAGDNPDPEPGGWERLANEMHNRFKTDLEVVLVKPGEGRLVNAGDPFRVAHLTGTTRIALSPGARDEIKRFVRAGGTLIVDAAGGSGAFAESAAGELRGMFPPPPETLAADVGPAVARGAAVFDQPGAKVDRIEFRNLNDPPKLQSVAVGNRDAVFFSPGDLSAGLVGQDTDGIAGYTPETAAAIMRNLLLYAAEEH